MWIDLPHKLGPLFKEKSQNTFCSSSVPNKPNSRPFLLFHPLPQLKMRNNDRPLRRTADTWQKWLNSLSLCGCSRYNWLVQPEADPGDCASPELYNTSLFCLQNIGENRSPLLLFLQTHKNWIQLTLTKSFRFIAEKGTCSLNQKIMLQASPPRCLPKNVSTFFFLEKLLRDMQFEWTNEIKHKENTLCSKHQANFLSSCEASFLSPAWRKLRWSPKTRLDVFWPSGVVMHDKLWQVSPGKTNKTNI